MVDASQHLRPHDARQQSASLLREQRLFQFRVLGRRGEVAAGGERSPRRSDGRANRQQNRPDSGCGLRTRGFYQAVDADYAPEMITGINISDAQIADARALAPSCTFQVMNATKLDFPHNHFDAVICIEGACHFDTRDKFLTEAHRVLKPGGSLAMSDMLFPITILSDFGQVPRANLLPSIAEYCARLAAAGFVSIEVTDATDDCLGGFRANLARWPGAERRAGRMKLSRSLAAAVIGKLLAAFFGWSCKTYLLVSARKPS